MSSKKLLKSLPSLKGWREAAFILSLAERALPNAVLFYSATEQLENAERVQNMMEEAWESAILHPEEESVAGLLDEFQGLWTEDDSFGAQALSWFLEVVEQGLLASINQDKRRAESAGGLSMQTVTTFIEFSEGEGMDDNELVSLFDKHPLVKREISFQEELVDILRSASSPSNSTIDHARELAQDEGISNIGISLDE